MLKTLNEYKKYLVYFDVQFKFLSKYIIIIIYIFALQFMCIPNNIDKVRVYLEKLKYDIERAEEEYLPLYTVILSDWQRKHMTKCINNIKELTDVIQVYDNMNNKIYCL